MPEPAFATKAERKAEELKWLKVARALCSIFPTEEPEPAESPDFRFSHLGLGIEITEYMRSQDGGCPHRRLEKSRAKIVEEAKQIFESVSDAKLFVSIYWTPARQPSSNEPDGLAEGIALVINNLLAEGREIWRPNWTKDDDKFLGRHFGDIWIYRTNRGPSDWVSVESGAVEGDVNKVQAVIGGKESKLVEYRKGCGKVWLLIVADVHISSYFSPDEDFAGAIFRTNFDRVLLLDIFHNCVRELVLQPF